MKVLYWVNIYEIDGIPSFTRTHLSEEDAIADIRTDLPYMSTLIFDMEKHDVNITNSITDSANFD